MGEPDGQTDRMTRDQLGAAGWSWAAACQLANGVRVQQGAPVADALIRANAVWMSCRKVKKRSD